MNPISDVLVAFAVSRLTDGEQPVDVSAALDRALAGARWHNALLKKALQVVRGPREVANG